MRKWLLNIASIIAVIVLLPIELIAAAFSPCWKLIGIIVLILTGDKTMLTTWTDIRQAITDAFNSALEKL